MTIDNEHDQSFTTYLRPTKLLMDRSRRLHRCEEQSRCRQLCPLSPSMERLFSCCWWRPWCKQSDYNKSGSIILHVSCYQWSTGINCLFFRHASVSSQSITLSDLRSVSVSETSQSVKTTHPDPGSLANVRTLGAKSPTNPGGFLWCFLRAAQPLRKPFRHLSLQQHRNGGNL